MFRPSVELPTLVLYGYQIYFSHFFCALYIFLQIAITTNNRKYKISVKYAFPGIKVAKV